MEDLDNKWILNASSSSQDCREKDGNNPVTLGLENMRGVSAISIIMHVVSDAIPILDHDMGSTNIYIHQCNFLYCHPI